MESMIAITVAAILLAVGVPSLRTFRANNQITATTNSILTGLNLARFSAVMRGENVLICPSSDSIKCASGSSTSGNWIRGWIVYSEDDDISTNDSDNSFEPAENNIIRATNSIYSVLGNNNDDGDKFKQDTGFTDTIVFKDDGTTSGSTAMVIDVCYGNTGITKRYKQISVNPFGPISSTSVATVCS